MRGLALENTTDFELELLTPESVASLLHVDRRTVLRWGRDGKLQRVRISKKVILFTRESIKAFVKSRMEVVESMKIKKTKRTSSIKTDPKGGASQSSRKSWRSLRKEVAAWQ